MSQNRLAHEASPYLLQHADNPVDWWPWCDEALAEAQRSKRPILLSVGYAACHWCHVMAHESFEDAETAAVMNERYVNIKVDREERPDIDQIYMSALHATGEQGGWPLTMFLTETGQPFFGGTYFPKVAQFGRPSFTDVLLAVSNAYAVKPELVAENVATLRQHLQHRPAPGELLEDTPVRAAAQLRTIMDPVHGGTRGAPKFPNAGVFRLMWRSGARGNAGDRDAVLLALSRIAMGGITDHIGGGLARYSVDERWLVPHFEKMLYDNAQILSLYGDAYGVTGDPLYAERAREIVAWLEREMVADGLYAASLDADSEGEEGRFYVWSRAEIEAVLGADADRFSSIYDVTESGNFEGSNVLNRLAERELADDETEAFLARCRAALFDVRERRVRPGRDDKQLADWNALAIAALARTGAVLDEPGWVSRASEIYETAKERFGRGDRLIHAVRGDVAGTQGFALDYALMIAAALALYRVDPAPALIADAERWVGVMERHYRAQHGGYAWTADDGETLVVRPDSPADEAVPNANGIMVENAAVLWAITGEARFEGIARRVVSTHARAAATNVFGCASLLCGLDQLTAPHVTVSDAPGLREAVLRSGHPSAVLLDRPPAGHPAAAATPAAGSAVVCRAQTCGLPLESAAALLSDLWGEATGA